MKKLNRISIAFIVIFILSHSISAYAISVGDLVISEVMVDPDAVSDASGEWIEIFNTTASPIDLSGYILSDDDTDLHIIINGSDPVIIQSGEYFVLGNKEPAPSI